ncbi:helix-turn-helix transcriptional regulator [Flavobacterium sp. TSSA_36]|uniref:helix-turn-helix transcriptional regulator n=1 Tax=Flavobacterium sp. TSSA_36 TaxID=3447669 RepID=UPI003F2CB17F
MYINTILKEINKTIIDVHLKDEYSDAPTCTQKKQEIIHSGGVEGSISVCHSTGFCVMRCDCNLNTTCTDLLTIDDDYVHVSYLETGSFSVLKKGKKIPKKLKTGYLKLGYQNHYEAAMQMSSNDERLNYTRILLSKKFYLGLLKNEHWAKNHTFYNEVIQNKPVELGSYKITMNYEIITILEEIVANSHQGPLAHYYIHSKLKELFLMAHISETEKEKFSSYVTEEIEKLSEAKLFLEKNFHQNPSIKQLSRAVLLNECKLKKGFKETYNSTIHAYITQLRMQHARKLLLDKRTTNEVSSFLGYKSASHFIATFKKHFGSTPKQLILSLPENQN